MEVVGRHALLFDDDATCGFVNSREALVEWNSLLIDRYDVRHLLQTPPSSSSSSFKRRPPSPSPSSHEDDSESELDHIRYQDLPLQQENIGAEPQAEAAHTSVYRAVPFSYQSIHVSSDPGFLPPFPVPESLLQSLMLGAVMEFL